MEKISTIPYTLSLYLDMAFDIKNLEPLTTIDKEWLEKECAFKDKFDFELIVQYEHQQFELDFDIINLTKQP